jgi:hypothetical protein
VPAVPELSAARGPQLKPRLGERTAAEAAELGRFSDSRSAERRLEPPAAAYARSPLAPRLSPLIPHPSPLVT